MHQTVDPTNLKELEKPCSTSYLRTLVKTPGKGLVLASPQCEPVKLFRPRSMSNT